MARRPRRTARRAAPRRSSAYAAPRRSGRAKPARRNSGSGLLRIVVETPQQGFASVPRHLGEGGGIVPISRAAVRSDKARF